jgi:hypothetical protein
MIVVKDNKYIVIDTRSKEVINEFPFDDSRGSQQSAKDAAYAENSAWKERVINSK